MLRPRATRFQAKENFFCCTTMEVYAANTGAREYLAATGGDLSQQVAFRDERLASLV
jgi:hypothetical protein